MIIMSNNILILNKLNNYAYDDEKEIIFNYIQTGNIPPNINTNYKENRFKNRWNDFNITNGKLIYTKLNLEVVFEDDKQQRMTEIYTDNKTFASGIQSFYNKITQQYLNIKMDDVEEFIKKQYPYQLTQQPERTINKPIYSTYSNQRWACDLIDLSYYASKNRRFNYILTVIDMFSKYVFAVGLKNKEANSIVQGFNKIGREQSQNIFPKTLQSDNGTEFKNDIFKDWCETKDIKLVFNKTYSPMANGLVENFNKYLRKLINEGFIRSNSLRWIDELDDYVYNRNHTKHSRIKFLPAEVWQPTKTKVDKINIPKSDDKLNNEQINSKVLVSLEKSVKKKLERYEDAKLQVGDKVRILLSAIDTKIRKMIKQGDSKKVVLKFSPKVFTIRRVVNQNKELLKPKYYLDSEDIPQAFFYSELLKVDDDAEDINIMPSDLIKE